MPASLVASTGGTSAGLAGRLLLRKAADPLDLPGYVHAPAEAPAQGGTARVGEIGLGLDWPAMVKRALASQAEGESLEDVLATLNQEAYTLALQEEVAAAGGDAAGVDLTNQAVVGALRKDAERSAASIVRTFEKDLMRFADVAAKNGATEEEMPQLVAEWALRRNMWKDAQIAITESARAAGQAQRDFINKTGAIGTATFGRSLKCPICQDIAAGNPYHLDDPTVGTIPHVGCLDSWDISYERAGEPWTGG